MPSDNPAEAVELAKSKHRRRDHVTTEEVNTILRKITAAEITTGVSRQWLKDWIVFGFGTGLRPDEQQRLEWSGVRLAERSIEVGKGHRVKTAKSRRALAVRGAALDVLMRRADERTNENDGPVFTLPGGGPVALGYLRKTLKRFAHDAEVEKNVVPYSLRHGFGTRHAMEGMPVYVLARMMGTSVAMIEKHYGHYDPLQGAAYLERSIAAEKARNENRSAEATEEVTLKREQLSPTSVIG